MLLETYLACALVTTILVLSPSKKRWFRDAFVSFLVGAMWPLAVSIRLTVFIGSALGWMPFITKV